MNIPKLPERPKYSYWRNVPNGPAEEKETNDVWIRWHDEVLVPWYASLFKDAVEVLGFNDEREISFCAKWDPGFQPTHKALLINMTGCFYCFHKRIFNIKILLKKALSKSITIL